MLPLHTQTSKLFGCTSTSLEEVREGLLPEINRVLKECRIEPACVNVGRYGGGVEVGINLSPGWGISGSSIVASGARPVVDNRIAERLMELPHVRKVVFWDATGRFIEEEKKQEDYSQASIPAKMSVVVKKYNSPGNRDNFSEEFNSLDASLKEAGAPDDEDLGTSLRRLTQEDLDRFYKAFIRMPD